MKTLKNTTDQPLVQPSFYEGGISKERLETWFSSNLREIDQRLTLNKLKKQMKARGLPISINGKEQIWIEMINILSTTRELPLDPNWNVEWSIDGYEKNQEICIWC